MSAAPGLFSSPVNFAGTVSSGLITGNYFDPNYDYEIVVGNSSYSSIKINQSLSAGKTAIAYSSTSAQGVLSVSVGSTFPSSGIYGKGDIVFNSSSSLGLPDKWTCTLNGSPGTWVAGEIVNSKIPVTLTADASITLATSNYINNKSGATLTLTLLSAATYPGASFTITNNQAQTVVSASSNVVPKAGGAAGTAILAATAGLSATLVSNGTNWVITQ